MRSLSAVQLGRALGVVDAPLVPPPGVAVAREASVGLSQHAYQRIFERLTPAEQQSLFARLKVVEELRHKYCGHDWGLRLLKLERQRGEAWSDVSNGDEVWCVLRRGEIKTVMLRRSTQPGTASALRVDKVVYL